MSELTEQDLVNLRWTLRCNTDNIGFLGPTVKRHGPIPEMAHLVQQGLVRCEEDARLTGHRRADACGYWLTVRGKAAISKEPSPDE